MFTEIRYTRFEDVMHILLIEIDKDKRSSVRPSGSMVDAPIRVWRADATSVEGNVHV